MYFKIGHLQKLAPAVVMVVYMQTEVPLVTPVRLSSAKSTCPSSLHYLYSWSRVAPVVKPSLVSPCWFW